MTNHTPQIQRIKAKLIEASKVDAELKAFGASSHAYTIDPPIEMEEIISFEEKYSIQIPDCYKAFVLQVGNGGKAYANSGAGPFYGIYPFGYGVDEIIFEDAEKYIKNECILKPDLSEKEWMEITAKIEDDDIPDDEYDRELGRIYGGILPLGSQGCSYLHGIILNGEFKGRMVNLNQDHQKPKFAFEKNFLDWYERWLDEVISGDLLVNSPSWFGYGMGGSDQELLAAFQSSSNIATQKDTLTGLLRKKELSSSVLEAIDKAYQNADKETSYLLLQILVKFKHSNWKNYLSEFGKEDLLKAFQFIFWYDKSGSANWKGFMKENIHRITDLKTFRLCGHLIEEWDFDYGPLISEFIKNENEEFRATTVSALGKLKNKEEYLEILIMGLNDQSNKVIRTSLQALSGIKDKRLLIHYKNIVDKFPEEKDYILSNLKHRLAEFNLDLDWMRENDLEKIAPPRDKKWYQVWK